ISLYSSLFFFFNDTATTFIYTLSLHDALPIFPVQCCVHSLEHMVYVEHDTEVPGWHPGRVVVFHVAQLWQSAEHAVQLRRPLLRSEEHTSELQSRGHLVCRLLLEKKKKQTYTQ